MYFTKSGCGVIISSDKRECVSEKGGAGRLQMESAQGYQSFLFEGGCYEL